VGGVAQLGKRDTALHAQLADLLATTGHYRLQLGLIEALGRFEDPRAVPALEAFHARCQDARQRRTIERLLREPWAR